MAVAAIAYVASAACGCGAQHVSCAYCGWAEHMSEAQAADRVAEAEEAQARAHDKSWDLSVYSCPDVDLNDQLTTGGIPVTTWQPCLDIDWEARIRHQQLAARAHRYAEHERDLAQAQVEAEVQACGGLPNAHGERSIFADRANIANVFPHRNPAGQVEGVWVIFKPVPGLTADGLRRELDCERARWAVLGRRPTLDPDNPTLVPGAEAQVYARGDHLEVLVIAPDMPDAEIAVARAEGRLAPNAQPRTQVATRAPR